ncbi:hypothetical protein D0Y65_024027 [Glycine soja]|uniref:DUF7865 domain-containing protein n=1 Tax=Glycine soja TaxID=3848 RepID=A0A445J0D2_GLYSO|nr:hypothetical protein D0Y65_024027 [Glycine soja]
MVSSIYTLMCVLHSTIALTCGALMIFYSKEISVLGHRSETASKLQGTTSHDQLLIDTSDSFSGLLLFTIGFLLLMCGDSSLRGSLGILHMNGLGMLLGT